MIGALIALPFGGVIADRFDRRRVLLGFEMSNVAVAGMLLLALASGQWLLVGLVGMIEMAAGGIFGSSAQALRAMALEDDEREQGNALYQAAVGLAIFVGPITGAALFGIVGIETIIVGTVVAYVTSMTLIWSIGGTWVAPRESEADADVVRGDGAGALIASAVRTTVRDVAAGIRWMSSRGWMRLALLWFAASGAGNGMLTVSVIPWITNELGQPANVWGMLIAVMGLASLAASVVLVVLGRRIHPHTVLTLGGCAILLGALGFIGRPPIVVVAVALALFGLGNATGAAWSTIQQRNVPAEFFGRTSAAIQCAVLASSTIAIALTGLVSEAGRWTARS